MKSFDFSPWGGIDGFLQASRAGGVSANRGAALKPLVPWLAKAVSMTQIAIANLPFDIVDDAGNVKDTTTDWKNNVAGMDNPKRLIGLVAASLCGGAAYVLPRRTSRVVMDTQYVAPQTMMPQFDMEGLVWFDRATQLGETDRLYPHEVIYFWLPDSDVEIGPAKTHPLGSATQAASLLLAVSNTMTTYGERGFVPPTILGVEGMPQEGERQRAEAWWNGFLRNSLNSVAKIFNMKGMKVERVGAGMEELKGVYKDINSQAIEDIGAAFGIPAGLFMSDKAYSEEMDNLVRLWYSSSQFTNIYHTIEETFTDQLYKKFGYRMQFKPETIDAFQEDENERSQSFSTYVSSGIKPSVAAQLVGIDLPSGVNYEDLDKAVEEKQEADLEKAESIAEGKKPEENTTDAEEKPKEEKRIVLNADTIKELELWQQIAARNIRKGRTPAIDFKYKFISPEIASLIQERLAVAQNELDVVKAFNFEENTPVVSDVRYLADTLNRLIA